MPAYQLEPGLLEELLAAVLDCRRQIEAATAYLDQMDQHSRLVQATKAHLSRAEGDATTGARHAKNLRELTRATNSAIRMRRNGHVPAEQEHA